MFTQFLVILLSHFWNKVTEYQKPIVYKSIETHNNYRLKHELDGCLLILEIKQLRQVRAPRFPFLNRTVYQYAITQYTYKEGVNVSVVKDKYPEYCWRWFRNTKIPHLMAVNAFLARNSE